MRVVRIRWARVIGLGLAVACLALALKVESQGRALRAVETNLADVLRERWLTELAGKDGGLQAELAECATALARSDAQRELAAARAEAEAWRGLVSRHLCEDAGLGWRWEIVDYELSSNGIEMSYRSVAEPRASGGLGSVPACRPCADAAARALFGRDPVAEQARWASAERATHEVADLLEPRGAISAEALLAVVAAQAGGWQPPAALELHGTKLVVFHDAEVRARVERLLLALRGSGRDVEPCTAAGGRACARCRTAARELNLRLHGPTVDEAALRAWLAEGPFVAVPAEPLPVEIHDVQDLLLRVAPVEGGLPPFGDGRIAADALVALVRGLAGGDAAWAEPAALELHRGQLIVVQAAPVQARVAALLRALRACGAPPATRDAEGERLEFLDVQDLTGPGGEGGRVPGDVLADVIRGAFGAALDEQGSIEASVGILIVRAERPVHARLEALLRALRE